MTGQRRRQGWRGPNLAIEGRAAKHDDADLILAESTLHAVLRNATWPDGTAIPALRLYREPYLLIARDGESLPEVWPDAPQPPAIDGDELRARCIVRRPDFAITDAVGPVLIIEIDGGWHDTPVGRRRDDRRARDYRTAGIDAVLIRQSEYPVGEHDWLKALARSVGRALQNLAGGGGGTLPPPAEQEASTA